MLSGIQTATGLAIGKGRLLIRIFIFRLFPFRLNIATGRRNWVDRGSNARIHYCGNLINVVGIINLRNWLVGVSPIQYRRMRRNAGPPFWFWME
jgi:hypothetical protein